MITPNHIRVILIELYAADQPSLFILLASDGTINRLGTGSVNNTERDFFIARTSLDIFESLRQKVGPDLLHWKGRYESPERRGTLCKLSVVLKLDDDTETGSEWVYGSDSMGPPPAVKNFVIAAVEATQGWYEEQKEMAKG